MKKILLNSPLLLALSTPLVCHAEFQPDQFSAGVKLGMFLVDSAAAEGFEDATGTSVDIDNGFGFGLHGDYRINENWYVDVEYTSVSVDAKISLDGESASESIDVSSFAVYGAYRSTGQAYYLGKLGLLSEKVDADGVDDSDIGLSFSIGGGYRVQENFAIEGEFTCIEADIGFVGVTARYTFK